MVKKRQNNKCCIFDCLKRRCIDHPLRAIFVVSIAVLILVHLAYSFHSCEFLEAKISADALLAYFGVIIGFMFAGFANQRETINKKVVEAMELEPILSVYFTDLGERKCRVEVRNDTQNYYTNASIGWTKPLFNLLPGETERVEFSKDTIKGMLGKELERRGRRGQNVSELQWRTFVSVKLQDKLGREWLMSFASSQAHMPTGQRQRLDFVAGSGWEASVGSDR